MGLQFQDGGKAIRARRERLNFTQAEVTAALQQRGVDISVATYQRIEYGQTLKPLGDPKFVSALADILRMSPEDLLAMLGHIQPRNLRIDTRTQRILEIVSELDPDTREAAESILRVLLEKQQRDQDQR